MSQATLHHEQLKTTEHQLLPAPSNQKKMYASRSTMSLIKLPLKDKATTRKIEKSDASVSTFGKIYELPLAYSKPMLDFMAKKPPKLI